MAQTAAGGIPVPQRQLLQAVAVCVRARIRLPVEALVHLVGVHCSAGQRSHGRSRQVPCDLPQNAQEQELQEPSNRCQTLQLERMLAGNTVDVMDPRNTEIHKYLQEDAERGRRRPLADNHGGHDMHPPGLLVGSRRGG
jgi:hypothetical protein